MGTRWWPSLAVMFAGACSAPPPVEQPMRFSHKVHVEADMECTTCHETATELPAAGLPRLRVCAKCHKELQGTDPEEQKILEAVTARREVPWVQVNALPGHVYFSHRAHAGFAEMDCEACHAGMKALDASLARPNVGHLTMRACMDCHARKGANNECSTCH